MNNWFLTLNNFISMFKTDKQTLLQDMYDLYPKEFLEFSAAINSFNTKRKVALLEPKHL